MMQKKALMIFLLHSNMLSNMIIMMIITIIITMIAITQPHSRD